MPFDTNVGLRVRSLPSERSYTIEERRQIAAMCTALDVAGLAEDLMREGLSVEQARHRLAALAAKVDGQARRRDPSDHAEGEAVDDWLIERLKKFGMDLTDDQITRFRAGYAEYLRRLPSGVPLGRIKNDIEEEPEHEPGDRGFGELEWLLKHHYSSYSRW